MMRWLEGAAGAVVEWEVAPAAPAAERSTALVVGAAVRLEHPSGRVLEVPAFGGGALWRARARIDEPGTWRWSIAGGAGDGASSDEGGTRSGTLEVPPAAPGARSGGPLRVGAGGRHLETLRGEPFFYLGDTAWFVTFKGTPPDWERYLDRRAAQGYSVIQIQLLPFHWETPDPDGHRPFLVRTSPLPEGVTAESGTALPGTRSADPARMSPNPEAWQRKPAPTLPGTRTADVDDDLGRPNEPYFARVDRFCAMAAARGLYVMLALMWGGNRPGLAAGHFSTAQAVEFARYAVARYAAFPVLWSLSGDAPYVQEAEKWDAVGAAVEETDPYRHPTTNHLSPSMNWHFLHHSAAWHDFHMLQTGHRRGNTPDIAALPAAYSRHAPAKPVVNGEPWYERHPQMDGWHERARDPSSAAPNGGSPPYGDPFTPFDARYAFWTSVLGGATMGHGYGAQGLWNWKRQGDSEAHLGGPQIGPTWEEALEYAGGQACAVGAAVLRALPWWKLRPCPERIEAGPPRALARPSCARAPGEAWVAYLPETGPEAGPATGGRIVLKGLEAGAWRATWIEPQSGERYAAGDARPSLDLSWQPDAPPRPGDWVLVLTR